MDNKDMKIIFIVDGGFKIGLGHVYQALTLAKMLNDFAKIKFLTKSDEIVANKIREAGFDAYKLSGDSEILEILKKEKPNIVIIDKIDVPSELAKAIKKVDNIKLVIFTNLTSANKYSDIAVTADIGSNFKSIRLFDDATRTLYFYGPKYWILRKEFHIYNKRNKMETKNIDNILLIFGGSDPKNLTTLVTKELLKYQREFKIEVIIGASFGHEDSLNQVIKEYKTDNKMVNLNKDITNVAELMFKADVVICSPGLSAFEALYVGTPILVIPQDELQRKTYQGFFELIGPEDANNILEIIENRGFTYPNQENIIDMEIARGTEELIKEIIGDKR